MTTLNDEPPEVTEPVTDGDPFGLIPPRPEGIDPRGPIALPPAPPVIPSPPPPPARRGDSTIWMVAAIGIPLVGVWLFLASVIVWTAAKDKEVLGSIEGLLTALAVITIPASQFIQGVLRKWNGSD